MNKHKELIEATHKIYPLKLSVDSLALPSDVNIFARSNRFEEALRASPSQTYRDYERTVVKNLRMLSRILGKRRWVVIKTFSSYPHVTHDIDVLIEPPVNIENIAMKLDQSLGKDNLCDLHEHVSWTDTHEVSDEFFWKPHYFQSKDILMENQN